LPAEKTKMTPVPFLPCVAALAKLPWTSSGNAWYSQSTTEEGRKENNVQLVFDLFLQVKQVPTTKNLHKSRYSAPVVSVSLRRMKKEQLDTTLQTKMKTKSTQISYRRWGRLHSCTDNTC
jgi:hypothetical protein